MVRKHNIIWNNICHQKKYRIMVLFNMIGNQMSSEAVGVQAVDMIRGVGQVAPSVKRDFAHHVNLQEVVLTAHYRLSYYFKLILQKEFIENIADVSYLIWQLKVKSYTFLRYQIIIYIPRLENVIVSKTKVSI